MEPWTLSGKSWWWLRPPGNPTAIPSYLARSWRRAGRRVFFGSWQAACGGGVEEFGPEKPRLNVTASEDAGDRYAGVLRIAYADPPYPGQARRHYSHDLRCAEVDHRELIERLCRDFPNGWAMSTSAVALKQVLDLCPKDVRVCAWVKPFASFKPGVNPAFAWEPVICRGGRRNRSRSEPTVRDWCAANITLRRGLAGAKPEAFCWWLFEFMGMRPGDELVDLFPGSGAVGRAWGTYRTERLFPLEAS